MVSLEKKDHIYSDKIAVEHFRILYGVEKVVKGLKKIICLIFMQRSFELENN